MHCATTTFTLAKPAKSVATQRNPGGWGGVVTRPNGSLTANLAPSPSPEACVTENVAIQRDSTRFRFGMRCNTTPFECHWKDGTRGRVVTQLRHMRARIFGAAHQLTVLRRHLPQAPCARRSAFANRGRRPGQGDKARARSCRKARHPTGPTGPRPGGAYVGRRHRRRHRSAVQGTRSCHRGCDRRRLRASPRVGIIR